MAPLHTVPLRSGNPAPLAGNRFYQPHDIQTYLAITGDEALSLQPLEVIFAVVILPQIWVMQAVVLCAHQATVGISQVKIAPGPVKL